MSDTATLAVGAIQTSAPSSGPSGRDLVLTLHACGAKILATNDVYTEIFSAGNRTPKLYFDPLCKRLTLVQYCQVNSSQLAPLVACICHKHHGRMCLHQFDCCAPSLGLVARMSETTNLGYFLFR